MENTHSERSDAVKKLRELIKDVRFAMLTTHGPDDEMHARPMTTQEPSEFDGDLWFMCYVDSEVAAEVGRNPAVLASYSDPDGKYVTANGRADVRQDRAKVNDLWKPFHRAWFPDGPDDPKIALIRVQVTKAEYWESASAPVQAFNFIKAIATGKEMHAGDHEKLQLQ
jgi:general stress protein 26